MSAIDDRTRLVLVNAIYFKGDWKKKFDAHQTTESDFHVSATETLKVQMMFMDDEFYYGVNHNIRCQVIEMPYAGDTLSMFVILPDRSTTLAEVEKNLTFDDLISVREKFRMAFVDVEVWLPKFKMDEMLSLVEALDGLGMKDLFMEGVADLSGVDGSCELYVSKVLHRAVVDVNEEGTEAAAATAMMAMCCSAPLDPNQFRADRPFLFFIQHKPTQSILFLGRLVKPPSV